MDISENTLDTQQPPAAGGGQQTAQFQGQQMEQDNPTTQHGPLGPAIPLPLPPSAQNFDKTRPTADIDFDSLLLQQFSCLGTRDHDDLVEQFHSLMNNQMNRDAARFFLEMSNW